MQKELHGNDLNIHKREERKSDIIPNSISKSLVNCSIDNSSSKRYNPRQLKNEGRVKNESVCTYHKNRKDDENSLLIIDALYKKGLINLKTLSNIEKKYGRLD